MHSGYSIFNVRNLGLEEWGELWEDFLDVLVSESRKDEPTIDWEILKTEIYA